MKQVPLKWALPALILLFSHFSLSAQDTLYANSQLTNSNGLCLTCRVLDRNNAVNGYHNDYTTLLLGASLLGAGISQTLIFPKLQTDPNAEITIEIANNDGLSISLLGSVSVTTASPGDYNSDRYIIADDDFERKPNSNRLTYTFRTRKPFDRVTIQLNAGLLALGSGLRIYGAYTAVRPLSNCIEAPADVYAYYPLDSTVKDLGPRRLHGITGNMAYTADAVCDLAAIDSFAGGKQFLVPAFTMADSAAAFSVWVKKLPGQQGGKVSFATNKYTFEISPDEAIFRYQLNFSEEILATPPKASAQLYSDTGYTHITANYGDRKLDIYINGVWAASSDKMEPYISTSGMTAGPAVFRIKNMIADELTVYNRALSFAEIQRLAGQQDDSVTTLPAAAASLTPTGHLSSGKNILTIAPNPVSGSFRIHGDIPIENSILILTDLSGREVFRTSPASATLTLPANVSPGVYVLRLRTKEGKMYGAKLVVHR
ncbi:LamG-like jellyroll fold domain-containing protein [Chitinophaga eiseniae]|nr:LamG-like jellyroll fold domain-containing protein [Chitinophaga eiseniae]